MLKVLVGLNVIIVPQGTSQQKGQFVDVGFFFVIFNKKKVFIVT